MWGILWLGEWCWCPRYCFVRINIHIEPLPYRSLCGKLPTSFAHSDALWYAKPQESHASETASKAFNFQLLLSSRTVVYLYHGPITLDPGRQSKAQLRGP